jgi:DNA polymerase-1
MQKFIKRFKREYQQIDFYQQYIPELARSQGCMLRSVFDRERHIIGLNSPDRKLRGEAERQAVNFTIQNPAAEITLGTMNRVDAVIDQNHLGVLEKRKVLLLNSVHDSLSYEVATYLAPWFAQSFKIVAERPIPQLKGASFSVKCGYYNGSWARAEMAAV